MEYILAIDGGGTKTHVLAATLAGEVLGEGLGGPSNFFAVDEDSAVVNILHATHQAVAKVRQPFKNVHVVMGMAGVDSPQSLTRAIKMYQPLFDQYQLLSFKIVNDSEIALANGTDKPNALVLIAGTGSICLGHNQAGQQVRAGGLGHVLGDEGSGFALGIAALKVAAKSADGRIPHSLLQDLVLQNYGFTTLMELDNRVYNPPITKAEIAELAPLVITAAQQHDEAALDILDEAVAEWIQMIFAVVTKLGFKQVATDLVLSGSLTQVPMLFDPFATYLAKAYPTLHIIRPSRSPVYGALALAQAGV